MDTPRNAAGEEKPSEGVAICDRQKAVRAVEAILIVAFCRLVVCGFVAGKGALAAKRSCKLSLTHISSHFNSYVRTIATIVFHFISDV